MDVPTLIGELRTHGTGLADAAGRLESVDPVPTCPGWTIRDLLLHIGGIHRWATAVVREARPAPIVLDQPYDIVEDLPDDDALLDWFRAGHADLVAVLTAAPADLACWAFLRAPTPLAFWARRQAHETAIHRVDAESAVRQRDAEGAARPGIALSAEFAADGVDELLTGFVSRRNRQLHARTERTLHVHATDVDAHWLVRIGSDKPVAERLTGAPAEAPDDAIAGPATALYLALWNRAPWDGIAHTGGADLAAVADLWSSGVAVRWS